MNHTVDLADKILSLALKGTPEQPGISALRAALTEMQVTVEETHLPVGVIGASRPELGCPSVIYVDSKSSLSRKVFTVAHELAHLMLNRSIVVTSLAGQLPYNPRGIEQLCDSIAGALLIPTQWVQSREGELPKLSTMLSFADEWSVSPSVLAIRWSQLDRPCLFAIAHRSNDNWRWAQHAGRIPGVRTKQIDASFLESLHPSRNSQTPLARLSSPTCALDPVEIKRYQNKAILWVRASSPKLAGSESTNCCVAAEHVDCKAE